VIDITTPISKKNSEQEVKARTGPSSGEIYVESESDNDVHSLYSDDSEMESEGEERVVEDEDEDVPNVKPLATSSEDWSFEACQKYYAGFSNKLLAYEAVRVREIPMLRTHYRSRSMLISSLSKVNHLS